jgi:glycosyl transferase family 25
MFSENFDNSQIAISLSHFYAYKQISDKYECALIFEDDVVLSDNFIDKLNNYMSQLPENFDMLFIGDGCNLHIENDKLIPNKNIYEKCLYPTSWGGDGASRCCDSYIISKNCANKLCEYIKKSNKINLPIDWWLNVASRDNIFKVYWAEPTIVTQGTQNGLFTSSH